MDEYSVGIMMIVRKERIDIFFAWNNDKKGIYVNVQNAPRTSPIRIYQTLFISSLPSEILPLALTASATTIDPTRAAISQRHVHIPERS